MNKYPTKKLVHIKTYHRFHLVDPSPWPILASIGAFMFTLGLVLYINEFVTEFELFETGFVIVLYAMGAWWRDVIREATFEDNHSAVVRKGIRLGMALFIISEVMFFFSFFWGFFHSSLSPVFSIGSVWPPAAISTINTFTIPLTNTLILITSGASVTWGHESLYRRSKTSSLVSLILTISAAILFTYLQFLEYINSPFNISDGIYGSCFYLSTGFHGFHVIAGTIALIISLVRFIFNHYTKEQCLGFDFAIWYWHFVDVVWLFLFVTVYLWGSV